MFILNPFLPPNFPVELEQRNFVGFLVFGPVFQKKKNFANRTTGSGDTDISP